jgi:hypothetical protein
VDRGVAGALLLVRRLSGPEVPAPAGRSSAATRREHWPRSCSAHRSASDRLSAASLAALHLRRPAADAVDEVRRGQRTSGVSVSVGEQVRRRQRQARQAKARRRGGGVASAAHRLEEGAWGKWRPSPIQIRLVENSTGWPLRLGADTASTRRNPLLVTTAAAVRLRALKVTAVSRAGCGRDEGYLEGQRDDRYDLCMKAQGYTMWRRYCTNHNPTFPVCLERAD